MIERLVLLIVLIILNGFFSCAEIAVLQVGDTKLKKLAEEGKKDAKILLKLTEDPSRFLSTIQVAITLAGFLSSAFAADSFAGPATRLLIKMGVPISEAVLSPIVIVVITLILSYVNIVFGELVPKRLAQAYTEKIALSMAPVLQFASVLFRPFVGLLTVSTNTVMKLMGINPEDIEDKVSEEDIIMMLDEGTENGTIEHQENEMIQNVFEFNDLTVEDVCTHRTDVAMLYYEDSDEVWRKTIYNNRFANYPICGEDDDDVIGILDTKDYFRLEDQSRDSIMKNAVDKPFFVSQNMKVSDLFQTMKRERKYYAVVIDEYGGMTGIVSMHDLIEALVGDLQEEDDLPEPEPIEAIGENEWIILGIADLEDVNEALKLDIPTEDADTFGGYIMGIMGTVPDDGSSFHLETDNLEIDVAYIKNHRIGKTIVRKKISE
ncbi:putative hemolysin [Oribacterium sp. KHPX15]|uniref:hemolysin family protein n=1 Tax=Oribacterium sp. KHPX15 TaxID=1855342 RepID=UPI00089AA334|nr:hemolysin family protein [Oribacterium sp. KHPX15]SEA54126.1 putative hemolysin [Oribacterium sp. KHPX15]